MENIYTNKNTTCFIFTAKKEIEEYEKIIFLLATDEYTITPKKEIEIISNGVEVFKKDDVIYKQYFFVDLKERMKKNIENLYENKQIIIDNILFKIPKKTENHVEEIKRFKSFQYYKIHRYNCDTNDFFDEIDFYLIRGEIDKVIKINLKEYYSKKIFPLFYIKPSSLDKYMLSNNVIIYKELVFKGIESKTKGKVSELKGYIQMDDLDIKDISIILKNKKNDEEVRAIIDNKTGEYSIKSSDDIFRGELIYFHKGKEFHSEDYSLIKDFKIDFNILDTTVELIGGQKVNFSKKKLKDNDLMENNIEIEKDKFFFKNSYSSHNKFENYINDTTNYIKNILNICSPNILICDPYFLGELHVSDYKIFINALTLAMTEYKIKNIYIISSKKNFDKNFKEEYKVSYRSLIEGLKKINSDLNIEFILSDSYLHDRCILKVDLNKGYSEIKEKIRIFYTGTSINSWKKVLGIVEVQDEIQKAKIYTIHVKMLKGERVNFE